MTGHEVEDDFGQNINYLINFLRDRPIVLLSLLLILTKCMLHCLIYTHKLIKSHACGINIIKTSRISKGERKIQIKGPDCSMKIDQRLLSLNLLKAIS
jgi:hypothetical protein